jgi:hypothetical protein
MRPAGRASDTDVIGCNRLTAILVVGGNGFFGACVGYIDYIKDALEITRLPRDPDAALPVLRAEPTHAP